MTELVKKGRLGSCKMRPLNSECRCQAGQDLATFCVVLRYSCDGEPSAF